SERHDRILDHYEARKRHRGSTGADAVPYKPLPPKSLYLGPEEVDAAVPARTFLRFSRLAAPHAATQAIRARAVAARDFEEDRAKPDINVFEVAVKHIGQLRTEGKKVLIAGWSEGSTDRLVQILTEHKLGSLVRVETLNALQKLGKGQAGVGILPLEAGFE